VTSLLSGSEYLEDWLPWELCLDARRDVVLTRTGGLLCAAQVEGPDLETASPEALDALHARLVDAFDGLGTGWSVWLDQWRVPAPGYLPEPPADAPVAARLADASFRRRFTGTGRPVFRNDVFVALHYVPQDRDALLALLTERGEMPVAATVAHFRETTESVLLQLSHTMRRVELLAGDDLASYLHASVSYRTLRVSMPGGELAPQMAGVDWVTTPAVEIDGLHLATVEVHNFGSPSATTCEGLHELPFPCRW
jgi:type IV secretory pathway VirB4 component